MNISKNVVCHALSGPGATTVAPLQNWSLGLVMAASQPISIGAEFCVSLQKWRGGKVLP